MTKLINNRYNILQTLGTWNLGKTYLVEDTNIPSRRKYVVKHLLPATREVNVWTVIKKNLEQEVSVLEKLGTNNDYIPTLQAFFVESEEFFLVQDWIEGQSLAEKVNLIGLMSENAVRNLLINLLPVLEKIHSSGNLHRNIKPENIIVGEQDGKPVFVDLGRAKEIVATEVNAQGTPRSSTVFDSTGFMPLEQIAGKAVFASDLYSLGLTAIYSLTGKRPNEMTDLATGEIDWHKYAPSVNSEFVKILNKTVSQNVQERYKTAQEIKVALKQFGSDNSVSTDFSKSEKVNASTSASSIINIDVSSQEKGPPVENTNVQPNFSSLSSERDSVKPWAFLIVFLYFFALVSLTLPELIIAFVPGQQPDIPWGNPLFLAKIYLNWRYWIFVFILVLCQVALLKIPVGIANRRQINRRSLLLPIIVTGFTVCLLVVGAIFSINEFFDQEKALDSTRNNLLLILAVGIIIWGIWIIIFFRISRKEKPKDLITKLCITLFTGSVLELLIAVPTHIIARSRDYCCAGFMTFLGIAFGIAIMLLSFGPGVFFLFQERWKTLHKYRD